jgi:hypothetical protein
VGGVKVCDVMMQKGAKRCKKVQKGAKRCKKVQKGAKRSAKGKSLHLKNLG